jgi:AdoMet-dependent heme synthase
MSTGGIATTGGVPEVGKGPGTIYWYLTNTCNQRCAHCWVTAGAEFGKRAVRLSEIREFFDDAIASGLKRIKFTGGEPMIHPDFREACDYFSGNGVLVWVESNGIRIDPSWVDYFASIGARINMSLDDVDAGVHDSFRGRPKSWETTVGAARGMVSRGMKVGITSSLTESNLNKMESMTSFALDDVGVAHVAFNPIIPFGRAASSKRDWKPYLEQILEKYERLVPRYGRERFIVNLPAAFTTSAMHQTCMLGDDLISVLSDGSISVCAFGVSDGDAVHFGDARIDRISDLWHSHEGIIRLRTPGLTRLKGICANCVFSNSCRGYCRAQALAEYGDIDAPYPICQHFAEKERFPVRYMINEKADISYQPDVASVNTTNDLLPKGDSHLRHLPLVPLIGRNRER